MKKFLLLILLTPFAYADMDKICSIAHDMSKTVAQEMKEKKCERNNILHYEYVGNSISQDKMEELLIILVNQFCRFDRNTLVKRNTVGCVLYDPKGRTILN